MQQLLVDELTGERVILVPARALRPDTFRVHAELVALDLVPPRVQVRLDRFAPATFTNDQEHKVVDGEVVVWCPPASQTPFTVRLALADGGPRFDEAADDETRAVGVGLRYAI